MGSFVAVILFFLVAKCVQLFFRDLRKSNMTKNQRSNKGGVHFFSDSYHSDSSGWSSGGNSDGGSGGGDCGGGGGD